MNEQQFLNRTTNSQSDFLQEFITLMEAHGFPFCIVGGLAVNAYAEPVVSLDLDVVAAATRLDELVKELEARFVVRRYPHSINVSSPLSDLRIQIQTDERYQPFVQRAVRRRILGYELPVATLEDVLQGKLWAYADVERRPSKRQKDLADILRLVETYPHLADLLPADIRNMLKEGNYSGVLFSD